MDKEPIPPEKPATPPPDIPKPTIPVTPDVAPVSKSAVPLVNVRIREAGDLEAGDEKSGNLAPFNSRMIAALIDVVLAIGLQISAMWILPGFASKIAWLVGFGYLVTRDSLPFLGGQSVGKKATKLKVVTLEDKPVTGNWEVAIIRNGVLLIPFFALIELFVMLSREDKPERGRRLGDEWAKTKVVIAVEAPKEADIPA